MSPVRIAINGFGRIGRCILRAGIEDPNIEFVGINDLADPATMVHLLKYDSVYGPAKFSVEYADQKLIANGKTIPMLSEKDPTKLPWKELGAPIVLECTGVFRDRAAAATHLQAGARKVIISAPAKEVDLTCCYGVNHTDIDVTKHEVLSNASCTTNCLAPIAKVLHETYGLEAGFMTTIHSYTADQRLMDSPHSDLRRARAAALSQIPTSTGAARAVGLVLPELKGKLDGIAIRVPTPNVSCLDLVATLKKAPASAEEVNAALKKAAAGPMQGVLRYCEEPLVSSDFIGDTHSSIVDAATTATNGNLVKILAWYDNEEGFSCRMLDVARYISERL